jgi:hypothetical protein
MTTTHQLLQRLANPARGFRPVSFWFHNHFLEASELRRSVAELRNVAAKQPAECAAMRQKLLDLLRATREPYFDVLIEHGVKEEEPVPDVAAHPGRGRCGLCASRSRGNWAARTAATRV